MMMLNDPDQCVQEIIKRVGPKIVLATPLGLGKPVQLLNALYRQVKHDSTLSLTILTALSFCRPRFPDTLVNRLAGPYVQRVFGDYEDLLFEIDRRAQTLPSNVRVVEFFLLEGAYLNNPKAQRDFIYVNYTHVVSNIVSWDINVVAPMVAYQEHDQARYSLSCNADLTKDLLKACPSALLAGQINTNLPYMHGEQAEIDAESFFLVLKNEDSNRKLFSIPKEAINLQEYLIGFYASSLIRDDGCLQIGIGSLSDAVIYGLVLRHTKNELYQQLQRELRCENTNSDPFSAGLFALTEMLVDGYWELYAHGILKKELPSQDGPHVAHAGFFIGSSAFYQRLRELPNKERQRFSMRSISEINQLYGDEHKRRRERTNACFVNSCLKVTLLGEMASDTLNNGLTISGVGGQYNFVAMAYELANAQSIMLCRSVYKGGGKLESNVVFNYGPATIPRHLRDIIVTEYGIAYLRGKTDEEIIKSMLNIADSRFQKGLLQQAQQAKKISKHYEIPAEYRNNLPERAFAAIRGQQYKGLFPAFPFGCEFEEDEIALTELLQGIKAAPGYKRAHMVLEGLLAKPSLDQQALLKRMGLAKAQSLQERWFRVLLLGAMKSLMKDRP